MRDLFSYSDYRELLRDFYLLKKSEGDFTFEKFSQLAGLKSRSYYKSVMEGQRDLNTESTFKTAQAMGLSFDEQRFFEALVLENQSEVDEQRAYYQFILKDLRNQFKSTKTDQPELLEYPFFLSALTLMADHPDGVDLGYFAALLKVKVKDAESFLAKMLEQKVVERRGALYYYNENHTVFHDSRDWKLKQKKFLLEQVRRGLFQCERSYDKSKLYSQVFLGRRKNMKIYQDLVAKLLSELAQQESNYELDRTELFQINLQIFEAL